MPNSADPQEGDGWTDLEEKLDLDAGSVIQIVQPSLRLLLRLPNELSSHLTAEGVSSIVSERSSCCD